MNLASKVKTYAVASSLGLANILFNSGCESAPNGNGQQSDPGIEAALLGGALGILGAKQGALGNANGALAGSALSNVMGGVADYQRNSSVAQQGRSQINVNYPGQQQQVQQQKEYEKPEVKRVLTTYIGNEWIDKDGDSSVSLNEIVGLGRDRFRSSEKIELGVFGVNNDQTAIKLIITNINTHTQLYETQFSILPTNSTQRWDLQPETFRPGIYKMLVVTDKDVELKEILFEITP